MCEPPPVDEQNACNISARNGASFHNRSGPVFGWRFHEPFRGQEANPMSQVSALQLLCAAVDDATTCDDDGDDDWCAYDPPNPPPEPLTCDDAHTCPRKRQRRLAHAGESRDGDPPRRAEHGLRREVEPPPMALSGIMQGAAVGLILSSWLVVAYAVVGSLVWNYAVSPHEEADLEAKFGDEFRAYRDSVRCWIPQRPALLG